MNTTDFITSTSDNPNLDINLLGIEKFLRQNKSKWQDQEIEQVIPYMRIHWQFYIEMRSWGVKSFGAYGTKVELETTVEHYVGDSLSDETDEIEFDLTKDIKDFEIDTEHFPKNAYESRDMFCIESVDVDFDEKKITIFF
tara:strand:- start:16941 stop:17360 length:420 start_codon:yes stop_codon:yes gene_type:complete